MSTPSDSPLKLTPLHAAHAALGARMGPFGGYDMPIQYAGIMQEHQATRHGATVFDTCHMGEFTLAGPTALADLERLVSCHVGTMQTGQCRYGMLCNAQGGVIDDLLIYRLADDDFWIVVNAGTQDHDFDWICANLSPETRARNVSAETAKIDLQGPASPRLMARLMNAPINDMRFYRFQYNTYRGKRILTSRTGYTGEIGFEIYSDAVTARQFWNDCLAEGAEPAGLGARDTLRLEMGMPLYGHELDDQRNAAESGFTMAIAADKPYVGSDVIQNPANMTAKLVGLQLDGRRAARAGDTVCLPSGEAVGTVTSGSYAPSLETAIALAYVRLDQATADSALMIQTTRQLLAATVVPTPFYKRSTARKDIREFSG